MKKKVKEVTFRRIFVIAKSLSQTTEVSVDVYRNAKYDSQTNTSKFQLRPFVVPLHDTGIYKKF